MMDNSSLLRRHLNQNLNQKQLPKLEKSRQSDSSAVFRVSALKISPHPCSKNKRLFKSDTLPNNKEKKLSKNIAIPKLNPKVPLIQMSASQDFLESQRAYWKKLEENEFRQSLQTRSSLFNRDSSSYIIKTLYLPHGIKNLLSRNQTSQCSKYRKFLSLIENDPFHASNFFINPKATSFYELLDIRYENPTFFPYFNKNNRELCKDTMVVPIKFPNNFSYMEETIQIMKKPPKVIENPTKTIPFLQNLVFSPQKVACPYNFFIINFESICRKDLITLREGITDCLQLLCRYFHIVLVTSSFSDRIEEIIEDLELDEVLISAVYKTVDFQEKNWKILNFSEIFEDFHVENPQFSCLIISNHNVCQESEDNEKIYTRFGSTFKLNCEKVPAVLTGVKNIPVQVLLPSFFSGEKPALLRKVTDLLVGFVEKHFYLRNKLNFKSIFKRNGFSFVESNVPGFLVQRIAGKNKETLCEVQTKLKNLFIV